MTALVFRGVRLIDPGTGLDQADLDCLVEGGRIAAVGHRLAVPPGTTEWSAPGSVLAPAFFDCHVHLRTPGEPHKETIAGATEAAARGGFATCCAMANTDPPVDDPQVLRDLGPRLAALGRVSVRQFAACTKGLRGREPVDVEALCDSGAAGFSDDGRHAMEPPVLAELLRRAVRHQRVVAIHPEDEGVLAAANRGDPGPPTAWARRPPEAELRAVTVALDTLARSPGARLHLQHCSTRLVLDPLRAARRAGLAVTAEVTPHHLALSATGLQALGVPAPAAVCNPPLRQDDDRDALWAAVLDGTIDAIATDHAPHEAVLSGGPAGGSRAAPGFSGLEVALGVLLTLPGAAAALPRLVAALTVGPWRVLGPAAAGGPCPSLLPGARADCVWFDPGTVWTPAKEAAEWRSGGRNTPFWTVPLRGRVLATLRGGRAVFRWTPAGGPGADAGGRQAPGPLAETVPGRG
ncbi:MAG TPA: amidohydrolase family protein [Candidatus Micrarchaeia archaeon]|nr:amidohydrolase family protein [Candidatus Micrarchaeia archaeon]